MASLSIQFARSVSGTGDAPVVAEVLNDELQHVWRGIIRLGRINSISVARPGHYLVRAWMPNGELMSTQAEVSSAGPNDAWMYPEQQSPSEDLAWAYYAQPPHTFARPRPRFEEIEAWALARGKLSGAVRLRAVSDEEFHGGSRRAGEIEIMDMQGNPIKSVSLEGDGPSRCRIRSTRERAWLEVETEWISRPELKCHYWAAIPSVEHSGNSYVEAILRVDPEMGVRINVQLEPFANSLMSYLQQGDLAEARIVTDALLDQLLEPNQVSAPNPVLAAAAGYGLLRAGDVNKIDKLIVGYLPWLAELPDLRIIAAWRMLQTIGIGDGMWRFFREAADGHVPLFSLGVRLLFELGEMISTDARGGLSGDDLQRIRKLRKREEDRQRWSITTVLPPAPAA